MDEKPRSLDEPILNNLGLSLIGIISITSAVAALYLFNHMYTVHFNELEGRSIVFASFAINSMIYIFAYRSLRRPLWRMNKISENKPLIWAVAAGLLTALLPFLIPALGKVLEIVPLGTAEWLQVSGIAFGLLCVVEIGKWINNKMRAND